MFTDQQQEKALRSVNQAIEAIKQGRMIIMVDDEDRENEGDLVVAADLIDSAHVNFMAKEARGLICLSLERPIIDRLGLPMMGSGANQEPDKDTAFTVSIEARHGVSTGISAQDRAHTVKVAIADGSTPADIVVPGHVFPLKAKPGGVLERAGHTEGSVDIARLAGRKGAAVICEIMNDDGTMARMGDLEVFAKKHDMVIVSIEDLITYRLLKESLVELVESKPVKTAHGTFTGLVFKSLMNGAKHFALANRERFSGTDTVDIRVHNQRPLVDVFGGDTEGGRFRLDYGLKMLAGDAPAALVYLTHPDKGQPFERELAELADGVDSRAQQAGGSESANKVDMRMLGTGAQIIRALGVKDMRIHTTQDLNFKGLSGFGLTVADNVLMPVPPSYR